VHACHIIPQRFGDEEYRRICGGLNRNEAANLVLLTPTLHAAFDSFMFSFAPTGQGTHVVEVYVYDSELERHSGKIVRVGAGDAQLAAHRAECGRQGRLLVPQQHQGDPRWDPRAAYTIAHVDVWPAPLEGPNREPEGTTQWATDSERIRRAWAGEGEEREVGHLRAGINIREQPSTIHAAPTQKPSRPPTTWSYDPVTARLWINHQTGRVSTSTGPLDLLWYAQAWEDLCQRHWERQTIPPRDPDAAAAMGRFAARQ
jgi:hypothetical protein